MTALVTDRRSIEAREDPEGERLCEQVAAEYLDVRIRMARALSRIEASGAYHFHGCSSAVQYAVNLKIPAADARILVELGRVLDVRGKGSDAPEASGDGAAIVDPANGEPISAEQPPSASVEDRIRSGEVPVDNAALVAKLLAKPGLARPGEDWIGWAGSMATGAFRRCVHARLEEVAQGTRDLLRLDLHVTRRAREGFDRARVVASRDAGTILTQGQTFALIVDRWLDAHDEMRRGAGARRAGPTSAGRNDRYVPAAVRRRVLERSEDRCEVPACTFGTFLEVAHIEAHAAGGSREAENLLRLCHVHHTQFDAGFLRFNGWRDGRPTFRVAAATWGNSGRDLDRPRARSDSHPRSDPEAPAFEGTSRLTEDHVAAEAEDATGSEVSRFDWRSLVLAEEREADGRGTGGTVPPRGSADRERDGLTAFAERPPPYLAWAGSYSSTPTADTG